MSQESGVGDEINRAQLLLRALWMALADADASDIEVLRALCDEIEAHLNDARRALDEERKAAREAAGGR